MTRLPWCVAWMSIALASHASVYPVSVVTPDAPCHGSIREAAVAGIRIAAGMSRRVEYGGAVLQRSARCFVHSAPVTSNQPSSVDYIIRTARVRMKLVGIYHTHTPGGHASEFSQRDRAEQKRLGVPSYLGTIGSRAGELTIRVLGEV